MDYKPKADDLFEAVDRNSGKVACGCPCKATAAGTNTIMAVDKRGAKRQFDKYAWRFKKIETYKRQNRGMQRTKDLHEADAGRRSKFG